MRVWRGLLTVVALVLWAAPARGEEPAPAASLSAAANPVQPAHRPILITLTVHNTGKVPLRFWWSGWADYPDAASFRVEAQSIDGRVRVRSLRLFNRPLADATAGAVRTREVLPGRSVSFPAAFVGLPPRSYKLRFFGEARNDLASTWPATFTTDDLIVDIRDDDKTAAKSDEQMLARVRADDGFAQFVSANYPSKEVRAALLKDLAGDDSIAAERAMDGLWPDDPPEHDAAIVIDVLTRHLKVRADDFALVDRLLAAVERYDTPESEGIVAKLAAHRPDGRVRDNALAALEKIERARIVAQRELPAPQGAPRDPAVVDALLKLLVSLDPQTRRVAYEALGDFPDDPTAVAALRAGLADPDLSVRSKVEQVLGRVEAAQLSKHPATQP